MAVERSEIDFVAKRYGGKHTFILYPMAGLFGSVRCEFQVKLEVFWRKQNVFVAIDRVTRRRRWHDLGAP